MTRGVVVVHGGAGVFEHDLAAAMEGCRRAASAGAVSLQESALDAVVSAVRVLEEDPLFNAGYGATLTAEGTVELDAAVMCGDLQFGAIAAAPPVERPVELARKLMEEGEHAFLAGAEVATFARSLGFKVLGADALITDRARQRWERARGKGAKNMEEALRIVRERTGDTVGAVALDERGLLAAATSTGGKLFKRSGRVGDTPLPGAGTYADDEAGGAASATGDGEAILRFLLCRRAVELLSRGHGAAEAGRLAMAAFERRTQGKGGLILVDRNGDFFAGKNTPAMPWAACRLGEYPTSGH